MVFDVTSFGAIGDGKFLNTSAIARAIAAVKEAGGGKLYFGPGTYKTGTIIPGSNMSIELSPGAKILGSENPADYLHHPEENVQDCALIECHDLENFTLTGQGSIDGNGMHFFRDCQGNIPDSESDPSQSSLFDQRDILRGDRKSRPNLIKCFGCSHLKIENVTLQNSAFYTLWLLRCQDVCVDRINIRNYHCGPNTDGIDIDCSKRVIVSNCNIETGDDAICLKSDCHRAGLPDSEGVEDVIVHGCVLWSRCCGIRCGFEGDGPMKNCLFSDLIIRRAKIGINLLSVAPAFAHIPIVKGTPIEKLSFRNILIEQAGQAIMLWAGSERTPEEYGGFIRDIEFSHITAYSADSCFIGAQNHGQIHDIFFHQLRIEVGNRNLCPDESAPRDDGMPSIWGGSWRRGGLRILRGDKITMDHVTLISSQQEHDALVLEDVEDFVTESCLFEKQPEK